jgi:hypothetical protein
MIDVKEYDLCEPAPFIYYENGQLAITDGSSVWMIIVTCEAMKATASPPVKNLYRLVRYAEFYRDLAVAAIERGEATDNKVWVQEADVLAAKSFGFRSAERGPTVSDRYAAYGRSVIPFQTLTICPVRYRTRGNDRWNDVSCHPLGRLNRAGFAGDPNS